MKKTLSLIGIFGLLAILAWKLPAPFAGNTFPATGNVGAGTTTPGAPLEVVGDFYKSDPSLTGTFYISHGANHKIRLAETSIGDFLVAGPGNTATIPSNTTLTASKMQWLTTPCAGCYLGMDASGNISASTPAGTTPTLQQVMTAGSTMTAASNYIDWGSGTNTFTMGNVSGTPLVLQSGASIYGLYTNVHLATTTYTVGARDVLVEVDAQGGAFNVTLPTNSGAGQIYIIKKITTTNAVTVKAGTSKNIDGSAQIILGAGGLGCLTLASRGNGNFDLLSSY